MFTHLAVVNIQHAKPVRQAFFGGAGGARPEWRPVGRMPVLHLDADFTTDMGFKWRQRVLEERDARNLSLGQVTLATALYALLAAGTGQVSHEELAETTRCSRSAARDGIRRLHQLGLIGREFQYEMVDGRRRQVANRYWTLLPGGPVVTRPELRRKRVACCSTGIQHPSKQESYRGIEEARLALAAVRTRREPVLRALLAGGTRWRGPEAAIWRGSG